MAEVPRLDSIVQSIAISGFTNDNRSSGHIDLTDRIPAGSLVLGWKASVTTRFTGSSAERADLVLGTPGEIEAFSASGPRILERGASNAFGDTPRAGQEIGVERVVRVTVDDGFDFDSITGGALTVSLYFVRTVA